MDAWRSRWIEGSATFTTVLSSMIMNSAKHIAASVHQRRLPSFRRRRSANRRGSPRGGCPRSGAGGRSRGGAPLGSVGRDLVASDDGGEGVEELAPLRPGERLH